MAGEEPGRSGGEAGAAATATTTAAAVTTTTTTAAATTGATCVVGGQHSAGDNVVEGAGVPPHWSRHLKCQVCFGYMQQPQTLACGHSFCRACLARLGRTWRDTNPNVSLRFLLLPCPTCRALFPSSTVLRGRAATSFLIQNLVGDWQKERRRMKNSSTITLRSICTQTENRTLYRLRRRKSPNAAELDMHEQFHKRLRLDDLYYRSMSANSSDSSEDADGTGSKPDPPATPRPNASETSTNSSASSGGGSVFGGPAYILGRRFEEFGQHLGGPRVDWSPGRVLLMSVWCVYSMVVVGIAQPMLPYMVLITLFFLVIILR